MSRIRIKVAGYVVEIETVFPLINAMWKKFFTDEPADFIVHSSLEKIESEQLPSNYLRDGDTHCNSKIEALVIHREVCEKLIAYDTFMIHGAALEVDNRGILFCGKSGLGKTTHLFSWLDNSSNASVINGDKPFVIAKDIPLLCGSPWAGKENMCNNIIVPLHSIVLMERAVDNNIEQISFSEAFTGLLQQVYRPKDKTKMKETLYLLQRLNPYVSFWRFKFNNLKDDCYYVAHKALLDKEIK